MIRKFLIAILSILSLSVFFPSSVKAEKFYRAERFDVLIAIQENGSIIVTETVEFRFDGEPFTFVFREISANETDGITFFDASMDGIPMPLGNQAGQVEVQGRDPVKVTWHFSPTVNSTHVFTVRYQVDGIIRKGDADKLIWRAIPKDHEYLISRSTITLTFPPKAAFLSQPTLDRTFEIESTAHRAVLTTRGIGVNNEVILTARFLPNSLTQDAPQWQIEQTQRGTASTQAILIAVFSAIGTLIIGGVRLSKFAKDHRREPSTASVVATSQPPSDISPALAGRLTGRSVNYIETIFDLAQRGALEVSEEAGFLGKTYRLNRTESKLDMRPHEHELLSALFKPEETQIGINKISERIASWERRFDRLLDEELVQYGWLDPERLRKREALKSIGGFLLILVILAIFPFLISGSEEFQSDIFVSSVLTAGLAGVLVGLTIFSISQLVYAGKFSILTLSGEEQAAKWRGFAEYLKHISVSEEGVEESNIFERYLAYATVFGWGLNGQGIFIT